VLETSAAQFRPLEPSQSLILWLDQVNITDIPLVGGKNASLGEMIQYLAPQGINVPGGFATTAFAYRHFLQTAGLEAKFHQIFADLDVDKLKNLQQRGKQLRSLILETPFPPELETAIREAYRSLCQRYGAEADVAVRSSATAEDLPDASFAGQQETYLNVSGEKGVLEACKKCFASLFTDRAISYRQRQGFDHFEIALSVCVQKMVRSDLATSGVMFSIDPETGFDNAVLISAAYGLGENVVQGVVNPDEYVVFKPTLKQGFRPILEKRLGTKAYRMVYAGGSKLTQNLPVPISEQQQFALSESEILQLASWACFIEDHYSQLHHSFTPMDIEWAKDGDSGELFIVQARPETVQSQRVKNVLRSYQLQPPGEVLVTGRSVGDAIAQGKARVIFDPKKLDHFRNGEVLVTDKTDPDWEPIMKRASAIVTDQGGRVCHAAIIARELGIPAVVGTENATARLKTGQELTVSCAEGDEGRIYQGLVPFEIKEVPLETLPQTRTQLMMNVGNPGEAFSLAAIPNDGVGLARLEFIIANHIKVHPLALIHYAKLADHELRDQLAELTVLYADKDKPQYFVDKLAQGVGMIAAAFYPKPVVVRLSDLKSNEYANLLGGRQFEPLEENPMLGWRGASRYCDDRYRDAFALECQAMKRVREGMGLTNVILMVPFCRTPEEGQAVLAEMAHHGLVRGENSLQVYVMCELPSNVVLADQFAQVFDGFSIGSNDLTQLTLGLDRDSALVARLFDERHPAVKRMIEMAIATVKSHGRKVGICGQAPSDYPEFARFLVEQGIDSISLNPDSVLKTLLEVAAAEGGRTV